MHTILAILKVAGGWRPGHHPPVLRHLELVGKDYRRAIPTYKVRENKALKVRK
jgi:hypothetical protein